MASPSYASPEMMQGQSFDQRVDIYSLGVMLYEMLVGDKPYKGATHAEIVANSIQQTIPLLPCKLKALQPLIDHMLAKDQEERIADARMISRYIKKYLRDYPNLTKTQIEKQSEHESSSNGEVVLKYVSDTKNQSGITSSKTLLPILIVLLTADIALAIWYFII